MAKKSVLGKGMASLLQETPNELLAKSLIERGEEKTVEKVNTPAPLRVAVDYIRPNPDQPRKKFRREEIEELTQSIKESGVLVPLIVTESEERGFFDLIAGERRLRAARSAGLGEVPVVVKKATDREKVVISIVENIQRSDLNCIEEALAYSSLMDEFRLTQEEVAKSVGKDRSTIANHLRILRLPRGVIEMIQCGDLSFGHAKVLVAVGEPNLCLSIAKEAVEKGFSVREIERLVSRGSGRTKKPRGGSRQQSPFEEKLGYYRDRLEQKTGFHCDLSLGKGGSGYVAFKFSSETEFNDILEFLMERRRTS